MLYWLIVTTLNPFRSLEARLGSARATRARASRAPPSPLERRLWNTSSSRDDDPRLVPVRELFVFLVIRGVPVPIQAITFIVGLSVFVVRVESPRLIPSRDPSCHPSNVVCFPRESRHRSRDSSIHHKQTNHASPSSSSNRVARRVTYAMVPNNGTAQNNPASTTFSLTRFAMPAAQSLNNPCITPVRIGESVYVTERRRVATLPMFPSSSVVSERESLPRRAKRSLKSKIEKEAPKVLKRFDRLLGGLV